MIVNFNLEKLDLLLLDFYKITGLTVSIWDSEFNQLSFQPTEMPLFCKLIKDCKTGSKRCFCSDKEICLLSHKKRIPQTHRCHAGLIDTAIPIIFNEQTLGYIMFGQVRDAENENLSVKKINKLCSELNINENKLFSAYKELNKYEPNVIDSAANILKLATQYLWLSDMIKIKSDDLASRIETYIDNNIHNKISIEELCQEFNVSKNMLYSISNKKYKMPIGSYVIKKKIDKAKHLLTTTEMPIKEICSAIGIDDYNYFTKVFKKYTGFSSTRYRKDFPFLLKNKDF